MECRFRALHGYPRGLWTSLLAAYAGVLQPVVFKGKSLQCLKTGQLDKPGGESASGLDTHPEIRLASRVPESELPTVPTGCALAPRTVHGLCGQVCWLPGQGCRKCLFPEGNRCGAAERGRPPLFPTEERAAPRDRTMPTPPIASRRDQRPVSSVSRSTINCRPLSTGAMSEAYCA